MSEQDLGKRVHVRVEEPDDHEVVRALVGNAFGGERVPDLLDDLRAGPAWLDLSFVADLDGEVVGHVAFTRAWVDSPAGPVVDVLVLSPLSVLPERHRAGIGTALVEGAFALLVDRPEPLVFLEGAPRYYSRVGFVAGGDLGFTRPSVHIPEAAFQARPLPSYDDRLAGALVYPDAFWRHRAVGLRPSD